MHPYKNLPDEAYWAKSVAAPSYAAVDPVSSPAFSIGQNTKVATAGSCFAQHIARHLSGAGFNYLVTERAHPLVPEEVAARFGYGLFTARYGNIYTARQLLQLYDRAFDAFTPSDVFWTSPDGRFVDPFRPRVTPGNYISVDEMLDDRKHHLACVRQAFEELDVFVFTLGLTEGWGSTIDGTVFPLCPGVAGGAFSDDRYGFFNFGVAETAADMLAFIDRLRSINPTAKVILTVSPVPLVATASGNHVLSATTYSKSVLRVAAEEVSKARPDIVYFPSFEIITGAYARGRYFAADLRSVTESGVNHVMSLFFKHFTDHSVASEPRPQSSGDDAYIADMTNVVEVICDEEALSR